MKINKIILISLILIISLTFISSISAQDNDDLNLTDENIDIIEINDDSKLTTDESECCDEETGPQTYYVTPDPDNPNQVQAPTVQPVIDKAKSGDTIVLNGTFVHCHFMINKTLTIIATPGTSVGVCPHHTHNMKYGEGPEDNGIFYISPNANGTVLSGFSFTNDFYNIATKIYNPFGVFVDADDVTLTNLTFNWVGVKNDNFKYNPQDFLFNSIILNNTKNTSISNVFLSNIKNFITSNNASNINTYNISIEPKAKEPIISKITVSNLNINVGDIGVVQVTLKDTNNKPIVNKSVSVIINGVYKSVTADENGVARLNVKYSNAGTYYAIVSYIGDDDYKAAIGSLKITVNKKATALSVSKATLKVNKAKKIKITLKSNGKFVAGKKITIKVNKKTFSAKTNSKGVASIKVKVTKKGTFKYTAKFAGDNVYNSASKTGKISVKK